MKILKFSISFLTFVILCTTTHQIKNKASQDSSQLSKSVDGQRAESTSSNKVTKQDKNQATAKSPKNGLNQNVKSPAIDQARISENAALKSTNTDFLNTISEGIANLDQNADNKSFNLNILIGNSNTSISNHNLRNVGSVNKV